MYERARACLCVCARVVRQLGEGAETAEAAPVRKKGKVSKQEELRVALQVTVAYSTVLHPTIPHSMLCCTQRDRSSVDGRARSPRAGRV